MAALPVSRHLSTRGPQGQQRARRCREVSLESAGGGCQRIERRVRKFEAASALLNRQSARVIQPRVVSTVRRVRGDSSQDLQCFFSARFRYEEMVVVERGHGVAGDAGTRQARADACQESDGIQG